MKNKNKCKLKTILFHFRKHFIEGEGRFDFLKELVANIADVATQEEEDGGQPGENGDKPKKM